MAAAARQASLRLLLQLRGAAGGAAAAARGGAGSWHGTPRPRWFSSSGVQQQPGVDIEAQSPARRAFGRALVVLLPASMAGVLAWGFLNPDDQRFGTAGSPHQVPVSGEQVVNWSATHSAQPKAFYQPETQADVEAIVADCAAAQRRLRVVGSGLSPNGIGFSDDAMLSLALLDRVLWVDPDTRQVRVEAGCRVQQVADVLKPYGLSLANYASIREQQIGGFTQVSAHGTGASIPPVDEQVVSLKLVTPAGGVLELSEESDPQLFRLARVGLGCLGVVTELTLQAVPAQRLVERTFVATRQQVSRHHASWLAANRHLRYMWLPYTDSVVVVQVNPDGPPAVPALPPQPAAEALHPATAPGQGSGAAQQAQGSGVGLSPYGDPVQEEAVDDSVRAWRTEPLRSLLLSASPGVSEADVAGLTAFELRDALLVLDPLSVDWVARVNRAEAEFWKRSAGVRRGYADQILGFDCGGQQWVLEVAFPAGRQPAAGGGWRSLWGWREPTDLAYMRELLGLIQEAGIPAHAPIEQRWTAGSSSPMSPAAAGPGTGGAGAGAGSSAAAGVSAAADALFSWVGIIMYLPTDDPQQRAAITARFGDYAAAVQDRLMPRYGAAWHWAKIEAPAEPGRLAAMRAALAERYPLPAFAAARAALDPHNILGGAALDRLIGGPAPSPGAAQ